MIQLFILYNVTSQLCEMLQASPWIYWSIPLY